MPHAAAVKPNLAFFEAYGSAGVAALERLRAMVPDHVPFIVDAKRGDIGSTAARQAVALYDVLGADAVTVNPYLGAEAIAPLIERGDRFAYVLCRTSNPGAGELQGLPVAPDPDAGHPAEPLWARVARLVTAWGPGGTVGLVVGATAPSEMASIRALAPGLAFLVPGVGAQGGEVAPALVHGPATAPPAAGGTGGGLLVNVSRGIARAALGRALRRRADGSRGTPRGGRRRLGCEPRCATLTPANPRSGTAPATRSRQAMPFINGIGPGELIIILIIALLVVGPGKLPDVGSALGKSIREFRKAATDVKEATSLDPAPAAPAQPAPAQTPAAETAQPAPIAAPVPPVAAAVAVAPVAPAVAEPRQSRSRPRRVAPAAPRRGRGGRAGARRHRRRSAAAPEVAAAVPEAAVDAPAELAPVDEQQPTPST